MHYAVDQRQQPEHGILRDPRSKNSRRMRLLKKARDETIPRNKSLSETLVDALGREVAQKIITAFGGTRIWVPVRSSTEARLARIIGDLAATTLCAHFAGDYLQVPNTIPDETLHRRIAELHRQGRKINDIALAVGRSRRTVFRLLRRKITEVHRPGGFARERSAR